MKKLVLLFLFVLFINIVIAAPVVDPIGVSLVDGGSFSITGNYFGTKSPVEPILWDTLDNIPEYAELVDGDIIPTQRGSWDTIPCPTCFWYENRKGENDAGVAYTSPVKYCTNNPRVSGTPNYCVYRKGDFDDTVITDTNKLYINWWFYSEAETEQLIGSNKFIRVWEDKIGNLGRSSWTPYHMTYDGDPNHDGIPTNSINDYHQWGGFGSTWHNLEVEMDSSGDIQHGYGTFIASRDGEIIHNIGDIWAITPMDNIHRFGFDSGNRSHFPTETHYFGHVYIDSSFAKIMICDISDWSQRENSHCEIQIPSGGWDGGNTIQFTANQGSFTGAEDIYLFVIDSDGTVSNGVPVSFGGCDFDEVCELGSGETCANCADCEGEQADCDAEEICYDEICEPQFNNCIDGTLIETCSKSAEYGKPWYCSVDAQLIRDCTICGCSSNKPICDTGTGICKIRVKPTLNVHESIRGPRFAPPLDFFEMIKYLFTPIS